MTGRAKNDLERSEMERNIHGQKVEDARCVEMNKMCLKAERMATDRRSYLLSEEENTFNNLQKAEAEQSRKSDELEQEHKLSQAVEDLNHQKMVDIKNNQLFQTNSHDARRAEKQLQKNLVKNELILQINEKKTKHKAEKIREYEYDLKLIEADREEKKKDRDLLSRKKQSKSDYNKAITDQMRDIAEKRQELLAQESKNIQPIGNLSESKECFKKKIESGKLELKTKYENKRMESDKINSDIEEYLTIVDKRTKQQEELKNKKKEEKDRIYNYLVGNMASNKSSSSSERVIQSAYNEQQKLNDAQLTVDKENEAKQLQRAEVVKEHELRLKAEGDRKKEIKEQNSEETKKIFQQIHDFNAIDQKRTNERRQKMMEYGNELRVAIDKKADLRNEQKTQQKNDANTYSSFFRH